MSIAFIVTIGVSFIYLLTIELIGQLTENHIIFLLAGFVIYLAPLKVNWYYQGIEDFAFITKVSLIVRTISVLCLFLFVREKNDLVIYVILSVLGTIFADIWNFIKMWRSGIHPKLTIVGLKQHMSPLLILFASSIAISIYTILDTLMLGFITDYNEVGYYTNAMHMSKIILMAVTSLSLVAVPRVSYYMKNKDFENINLLINKSFSVVSFLAIPLAIGLACISPTFIPLFFGVKFTGSIVPMMILSMLIIAIGLNNLTGVQILIGMGYDKLFLYSVLVGTVSNFVLNCILIPMLGAVGASIASVIAEILILVMTSILVYKHTTIKIKKWNDMLKAILGAILFIPLFLIYRLFFEGWWLVIVYTLSGAAVYFLIELFLANESVIYFKSILINKVKFLNK